MPFHQFLPPVGGSNGGSVDLPADLSARLVPDDPQSPGDRLVAAPAGSPLVSMWAAPEPMSKYRGAWGPDEVVAFYDFSTGVLTPFVKTLEGTVNASQVTADVVAMSATQADAATRPAYAQTTRLTGASTNGTLTQGVGIALDLTQITSSLNGKTPTRVKWWESLYRNGSTANMVGEFLEGSLVRYTTENYSALTDLTSTPWRERSSTLNGAQSLLKWRTRHNSTTVTQPNMRYYVTGIRLYATAAPYILGDAVDYGGKFYRSEVNNNSDTPGTSAAWTLI